MNCETSCIGSDPSALSLNLWHDDIYFIYKVYHCITGVALWNILLSTDLHFLIKIDPVIIAIKGGNLSFCSSVCCCTCDCLFFFRICFESGGMGCTYLFFKYFSVILKIVKLRNQNTLPFDFPYYDYEHLWGVDFWLFQDFQGVMMHYLTKRHWFSWQTVHVGIQSVLELNIYWAMRLENTPYQPWGLSFDWVQTQFILTGWRRSLDKLREWSSVKYSCLEYFI